MRKNALDERRVLDARDHLELPAAAAAALDFDREHAFEPLHPGHAHAFRHGTLGGIGVPRAAARGGDRRAQRVVRGEHSVVSRQMHARRRHECGKPGQQVERLEQDMRRAVAIRSLQLPVNVPPAP